MVEDASRLQEVFDDLKRRGLIRKRVRLVINERMVSSKASLLKGRITLNPSYATLSEESIRFILLHEEGHMVLFQRSLALLGLLTLVLIPMAMMISATYTFLTASSISLVMSTSSIVMVYKSTPAFRHEDEFQSDLHAANVLRKEFGVDMPSSVAEECFRHPTSGGSALFGYISVLLDTHPESDARVNRLRECCDKTIK